MDQKDVILHPSQRENLLAKWKPVIDQTFDIFTWTTGHELAWLCEMASRHSAIIEIGSYHGKSAKCMRLANSAALICCIDLPQDDRCVRIRNANLSGCATVYSGTSTSEIDGIARLGPYDLAFIDGGHLEEDVTKDISNILPLMAPGGIISGHDWRRDNPYDGVNKAVLKAFGKERVNIYESIWFVKL